MSTAERKRKQRAKTMANIMTEEQKITHKKESERRSQFRKRQMEEWTKTKKLNLKPKRLNVLQNIVNESKLIMINQYRSCQMYL